MVRLLKLSNQAQANTKMGGHLVSQFFFSLAEILGKFANSFEISKKISSAIGTIGYCKIFTHLFYT